MDFTAKIKNTIDRYQLFSPGDRVIVAVSGGPDSVTLLHVLNKFRSLLGLQLHMAHVNHNLRQTSGRDERFVHALAQKFNLPFHSASVHISRSKTKSSIEELAREARLNFLIQCAKRQKADCIALGHTQDDLAETILMRILRGTGLLGLKAIEPKKKMEGMLFIRPLLCITRREIESFVRAHKIKFCIDPTNQSTKFFRNKIRHELLPLLKKDYNNNIKECLANFSRTAAADYEFIEQQARQAYPKVIRQNHKKEITVDLKKLNKLHASLKRLILRFAIDQLIGNTRRLTFPHIEHIENLTRTPSTNGIVDLPGAIRVQKIKNTLTFLSKSLIK